jgi:hypothetical protein
MVVPPRFALSLLVAISACGMPRIQPLDPPRPADTERPEPAAAEPVAAAALPAFPLAGPAASPASSRPAAEGSLPPAGEAPAEPARPTRRFTLKDSLGRPIEVYPPTTEIRRAPLVVFLHATCMQPASVCDWFGEAGHGASWLVCPAGNSTCAGEPDWNGPGPAKATHLAAAIDAVRGEIGPFVDDSRGVLIGWSRGAFAARDILMAARKDPEHAPLAGRFRGLVLLAASVSPEPALLQASGITRVVMAAGDLDGSRPTMTAAVAMLTRNQIEARYVSLGRIGHQWPEDFDARMRESIAWAAGE